jgi:pilus assembly protein Flp/PilA
MNNLVLRATCFAQSFAAVAKDRRGVTAMEYGLIAALVAIVIIAAVRIVGTELDITFDKIGKALTDANAKAP